MDDFLSRARRPTNIAIVQAGLYERLLAMLVGSLTPATWAGENLL